MLSSWWHITLNTLGLTMLVSLQIISKYSSLFMGSKWRRVPQSIEKLRVESVGQSSQNESQLGLGLASSWLILDSNHQTVFLLRNTKCDRPFPPASQWLLNQCLPSCLLSNKSEVGAMKLVDPSQQSCAICIRNIIGSNWKGTQSCYTLRETCRESHCRSENATSCLEKVFQNGNTYLDEDYCTFYKIEALLGGSETLHQFFYVPRVFEEVCFHQWR